VIDISVKSVTFTTSHIFTYSTSQSPWFSINQNRILVGLCRMETSQGKSAKWSHENVHFKSCMQRNHIKWLFYECPRYIQLEYFV